MSDKNLDAVLANINNWRTSIQHEHQAHVLWCKSELGNWNKPLAVVLTTRFPMTADALATQYEHFINRISKRIYKRAYQRHKKRINNKSYIEGKRELAKENDFWKPTEMDTAPDSKIHAQAFIETPPFLTISAMRKNIYECWGNVGFAKITAIPNTDEDIDAVAGYTTKQRTKMKNTHGSVIQDAFIPA